MENENSALGVPPGPMEARAICESVIKDSGGKACSLSFVCDRKASAQTRGGKIAPDRLVCCPGHVFL